MSMFCIEAKVTRERHGDNSDEEEKWGKKETHTLECSPSYGRAFFKPQVTPWPSLNTRGFPCGLRRSCKDSGGVLRLYALQKPWVFMRTTDCSPSGSRLKLLMLTCWAAELAPQSDSLLSTETAASLHGHSHSTAKSQSLSTLIQSRCQGHRTQNRGGGGGPSLQCPWSSEGADMPSGIPCFPVTSTGTTITPS